jgi:citrate lyase subunit beta/citryl-CoA lyase
MVIPSNRRHDATDQAIVGSEIERMTVDLREVRSLLYLPGSSERLIAKARGLDVDLVILDLEDSVREDEKESARRRALAAAAEPWAQILAIRLNGTDTKWHEEDLAAAAASGADLIVVPRVSGASEVRSIARRARKPILAMIETAVGVLAAPEIARECAGLIAGTNDLAADLRLPPDAGREPLRLALQTMVLAARAAGIACFDGVFNQLDDPQGCEAEAGEARMLGFDGKTLIHPNQIKPCHRAFAPTDEELARAERLIAAATGGAERFEDRMIEGMHVEQARRLLERARR